MLSVAPATLSLSIIRDCAPPVTTSPDSANLLRRRRSSTALLTASSLTLTIPARAIHTRSHPDLIVESLCRTASFMRRLARLRSTAPPTFLPATNPQRTLPSLLGAAFSTTNPDAQVRPTRRTRSNCPLLRKVSTHIITNYQLRILALPCNSSFVISNLANALWLVADSEPPPPLGPACVYNATPTLGTHAGQESMLPLARNTLRLISTLNHPLVALSSCPSLRA
jgi:hypothetical protein